MIGGLAMQTVILTWVTLRTNWDTEVKLNHAYLIYMKYDPKPIIIKKWNAGGESKESIR